MKNAKHILFGLVVLAFLLAGVRLFAQDSTGANASNPPPPREAYGAHVDKFDGKVIIPMSRLEFQLSMGVLVFGILLIVAEIYLVRNKSMCPDDTVKFVIITIIIVSTLFLITAGYDNDQIAPAIGLLGTIAGYLLGKITPANTAKNSTNGNSEN
jgi:hypothetical protein